MRTCVVEKGIPRCEAAKDGGPQGAACVLAGVERPLEPLDELLVLDQPHGVGLCPEHRGELRAIDPIPLAFRAIDQLALRADAGDVFHVAEVGNGLPNDFTRLEDQGRSLAAPRANAFPLVACPCTTGSDTFRRRPRPRDPTRGCVGADGRPDRAMW